MLSDAIQRMYDVFAPYRPDTLDESCPCCIARTDLNPLQTNNLRELSADDLSSYAFKAMTTIGTVKEWKHFLPRICELIAAGPFPKNIEIVLAGKLEYAEIGSWPAGERDAVERYLRALWSDLLHNWPHHEQPDSVLCCFARGAGSLAEAIGTWSALLPNEKNARLHLAAWLKWGPANEDTPPPFWEEAEQAWAMVVAWLRSPAVEAVRESALAEWAETAEGAEWYGAAKR